MESVKYHNPPEKSHILRRAERRLTGRVFDPRLTTFAPSPRFASERQPNIVYNLRTTVWRLAAAGLSTPVEREVRC
jgi:hypothetical protein